jgi:TonB family protein
MSARESANPFDLLGQATEASAPVCVDPGEPPTLDIQWGSFHGGVVSSVAVLLRGATLSKNIDVLDFFRDVWIEGQVPRRAIVAMALWHIFFLLIPFPRLPEPPRRYTAFDNTELTWSGPINDFPLMGLKEPKEKPAPRGEVQKPLPSEGAEAYHPRQRIIVDPARPNHPRQTIVNSAAPLEAPKLLPTLPNIVQLQEMPSPAKPQLQISEKTLANLRPRERKQLAAAPVAPLDVPLFDQKVGDFPAAILPNQPAKPKIELNTGAAPRLEDRARNGEVGPAPEVASSRTNGSAGNPETFIALSATPGPPAPIINPPQGNLSARISISPEGKQPGVPGGAASASPGAPGGANGDVQSRGGVGTGNGSTRSAPDISITGGNPAGNSVTSGLGTAPRISVPPPKKLLTRLDPKQDQELGPQRTGPPNFAELPAGAQPEQIFASKKVYKLLVNMPNLNSAMGSWILNFSELGGDPTRIEATLSDISSPEPLRKVDPKYPPTLMRERVEGEVVLYAVIRSNGTVDSIQLVRGIDEKLDANAMEALSQWKFRPATKRDVPIDLEAIVHIPFNARREH